MPDPDTHAALITAGCYFRLLLADSDEAVKSALREYERRDRRSRELRDRLAEIEAALAKDGLSLPPVLSR